ncbi:DNA-directed DNA polymerase [Aeromonas caviae]|uniref:DNA polymerase III subunit alpha n=1 Tax=Aeromonas caviae TaxID=648 RepID=UPI0016801B4C|nr:DNA polymerase III subunit alpha [Aeromonas caviae]BCK65708.1 DNA-directed DNA polymerase [Aeromonas hydrophila]BCR31306.1 DNA-directed DNA polymerase [Aeromonas caviae]GJA98298.1 DNA-directed DNA polymerase [Aeromonas caviae]GJB41620.1 DNA-directed DNA polymerase [Aeromonas caviae]GJB45724.1 DNA-directed DNA polymerase [Aeromonas caviae]
MHLTNVRSHFSMGRAVSSVDQLTSKAKELGYKSVILTDDATISGMTDLFKSLPEESGVRAVIGTSIKVFDDPTYRPPPKKSGIAAKPNHFWEAKLLVRNEDGLKALFTLLTKARSEENFYYEPRIGVLDLVKALRSDGLIVTTGDFFSLFAHCKADKIYAALEKHVPAHQRVIELVPLKSAYFDRVNSIASQKALESDSRVMYSRPILYADEGHDEARDVMSYIIGQGSATHPLRNIPYHRDLHMMTPADLEIALLEWRKHSGIELRDDTQSIVDDCLYRWEKQGMCLPQMAEDEFGELTRLCMDGFRARLTKPVFGYQPPADKLVEYRDRLKYELGILRAMRFDRYFLLIRDIIDWSKKNEIMVGPARGSAGGSLVAFLIGVTDVDPIRFGLIFERFLNPDRLDYPDVDTDFMSSRRHEVINYITERFGADHVAGISNYSTLGAASAIRDVARIHNLPQMDYSCTKVIDQGMSLEDAKELPEISKYAALHPKEFAISEALEGAMRSLSRHAAGIVVAGEPLTRRSAVEVRNGEQTVNWDKQVVEDFGLIKLDILGLSTLDTLNLARAKIRERHKVDLDFTSIPLDDKEVLQAFAAGETAGVFQFVSHGMKQLLKDLAEGGRSLSFEDIYAATALFRPGPLQSGMTEEYVRIKQGIVRPTYAHPKMEDALRETRGVIVYQEQVMQIARDLCGYTMGESDLLRKVMGKKLPEEMEKQREKFVQGAIDTSGLDPERASELFDQIAQFAGYGFNKSHSVAYTLISYLCMWVKVHYPAEFFAASLSIAKEDELPSIVKDAEKSKIYVVPPCVNKSTDSFEIGYDAMREQHILYAPLQSVKQVSDNGVRSILNAREAQGGRFKSKEHFIESVERRLVNKRVQENLELVGAFCAIEPGSLDPRHPDRLRDQKVLLPNLMLRTVKASRPILIDEHVESQLEVLFDDMRKMGLDDEGLTVGPQPVIPSYGKRPKFMFITDAPSYSECVSRKFADGKSFNYTLSSLKEAELKKSDGYYTALVKTKKADKQLSTEEINTWSSFIDAEIELLKPPVIIAAGGAIARHLCPDVKGGWEAIAGTSVYDVKRDCTIIFSPNPQMVYAKPDVQTVLDNIMCDVAEMLR